jgi:hypothetical protein
MLDLMEMTDVVNAKKWLRIPALQHRFVAPTLLLLMLFGSTAYCGTLIPRPQIHRFAGSDSMSLGTTFYFTTNGTLDVDSLKALMRKYLIVPSTGWTEQTSSGSTEIMFHLLGTTAPTGYPSNPALPSNMIPFPKMGDEVTCPHFLYQSL